MVNLRSEEYGSDSRVPKIDIGSPLEDAERRDSTINSMFYNIKDGKVEDHTGKGLDDLRHGIIRTPLAPLKTFLDDPLRLLRTVRFAARFNFKIQEDIFEASRSESVRQALSTKVSYERIGIEMDKMMGGRRPSQAVECLASFGVLPHILRFPKESEPPIDEDLAQEKCQESVKLSLILDEIFTRQDSDFLNLDWPEELSPLQSDVMYSGIFLPFAHHMVKQGKQTLEAYKVVIQGSLKKSNESKRAISDMVGYCQLFSDMITSPELDRKRVGRTF